MQKPPIVILVETMGSANLGAVARSAAAFGLTGFRLVAPQCEITDESRMWATYGQELFPNVQTYETLQDALKDVDVAVALSRREGRYRHRHHKLASLQSQIVPGLDENSQMAYVFGNERSGLSRRDLKFCHYSAEIPVISGKGSLNLAHAVAIVLYEALGRPASGEPVVQPKNEHEERASSDWLEHLLRESRTALVQAGYPTHPRTNLEQEMVKLGRLLQHSKLETWEARMLLGMVKQVNKSLSSPRAKPLVADTSPVPGDASDP